jgi:hypothetical protein
VLLFAGFRSPVNDFIVKRNIREGCTDKKVTLIIKMGLPGYRPQLQTGKNTIHLT